MSSVTIEDARSRLEELIDALKPGEELLITRRDRPVARLVGERRPREPRRAGSCKGMLTIVSDDDEHLQDFAEYMP